MTDNKLREDTSSLIARFMGLKECLVDGGYLIPKFNFPFGAHNLEQWADCTDGCYRVPVGHLCFEHSWGWIMPVVEKIGQLGEAWINIGHDYVELCWHPQCEKAPYADYQDWFKGTKIEAVYNAVVEFIKWYNNQKD